MLAFFGPAEAIHAEKRGSFPRLQESNPLLNLGRHNPSVTREGYHSTVETGIHPIHSSLTGEMPLEAKLDLIQNAEESSELYVASNPSPCSE